MCTEVNSVHWKPAAREPRLLLLAPIAVSPGVYLAKGPLTSRSTPYLIARAATASRLPFGPLLLTAVCLMLISGLAFAQATGQTPGAGLVQGTVQDASGSTVEGAVVTLETASSAGPRTAITDQAGSFRFASVEPGNYNIRIDALGFAVWTAANVAVGPGDHSPSLSAVLQVATASSTMNVTLSPHEVAADQLKAEEKQRVLGVFPDFFVSYVPNAAPLTAAQKFHIGLKTITDPVVLIDTGLGAGIAQWRNNNPEFGQGLEGYGKRYGALYADRVSGILIGHVVMQSIFRQDPRYFYKGTGSFRSRALYAIGMAFVRKGDNGHWQPAYSDVVGGAAAAELSSLYYPGTSRPVRRLGDTILLGFGGRAADNLLHEFVFSRVSTHIPKAVAGLSRLVLPEGTPVSLISVEDWTAKTAQNGEPVTFMLAGDLKVDGVIVAPIGSKAWGKADFAGASAGKAIQVTLEGVRLKVGSLDVPLRSTAPRDGGKGLEYHRLENSGRIALTLYVAGNVTLPPAR
jgi:Carboxypeptidase regulatory-like domain